MGHMMYPWYMLSVDVTVSLLNNWLVETLVIITETMAITTTICHGIMDGYVHIQIWYSRVV